jgi:hypothetical protein
MQETTVCFGCYRTKADAAGEMVPSGSTKLPPLSRRQPDAEDSGIHCFVPRR